LIGRGVHRSRVASRDHEVIRACFRIDPKHLTPVAAAVGRLVDPPLPTRTEQRAGRGDEHDVVVGGIDDDPVDVLRIAKTHWLEGLTAVSRLVQALAP
jgi:hypothetical protein